MIVCLFQCTPLKAQGYEYRPPYEELDIRDLFKNLAIKTNLLGAPLSEINVGVERYFANRWSVAIQGYFPRWHNMQDLTKSLDANLVDVEGRYWLRSWKKEEGKPERAPLSGHFVGVYGMGGLVDFALRGKGYQATAFSTGITYGYSLPVTWRLHFEFSVSAGFITADYTRFLVTDDKLSTFGTHSGRTTWLGPTKGSISLVYVIGKKKKEEDKE